MNRPLIIVSTLCAALFACDSGQPTQGPASEPATAVALTPEQELAVAEAALASWQQAVPIAQQSVQAANDLRRSIATLLQEPDAQHLRAAQKQWLHLAQRYQPLEMYSHLSTLQPDAFERLHRLLYATGAYPVQPGYLDGFGPYQYSGLVHDVSLAITAETLREQHGMTAAEDAALGLYAIEFLLFGTPGDEREADAFAPGSLTAELRDQGFSTAEELPRNRRRQLLLVQAELLENDLAQLAQQWSAQAPDSLYDALAAQPPLRRYLLLLGSARIELSRVLSALGTRTQAEPDADVGLSASHPLPISLLLARIEYLQKLNRHWNTSEAVTASLAKAQQALVALDTQNTADAVQLAVESVSRALEALTTEIDGYLPDAAPNEPFREEAPLKEAAPEEVDKVNLPAKGDRTAP